MTRSSKRSPTDPGAVPVVIDGGQSVDPVHPRQSKRRETQDVLPEERLQIVELHALYGTRRIAERVGKTRKVVRRVLQEEGCLAVRRAKTATKLTPYLQQIAQKVEKRLTVTRILRDIRGIGYQGGRSILAAHVRELRAQAALERPRKKVKRRFETNCGEEMQVDWSPFRIVIAGQLVLVYALSVILCHCRKLFVAFYRDENKYTLLEGLATAIEYFQGCSVLLVLDNMTTAVLGRFGPDRDPIWHPMFLDFARHYGFTPFACAVRDPDRKGKIEKPYRHIFDDFLNGEEFLSWEHLGVECARWLDGRREEEVCNWRIHKTTGERPNEAYLAEREFLIKLPRERFPVYEDADRIVDADATLSIDGKRYNIPTSLANRTVRVRIFSNHFEVVGSSGQIAYSRAYAAVDDKRNLIIDPTLYAGLPRRGRATTNRERLDEAFLHRFPALAAFVDGLKLRMKTLAPVHLRKLLRLAEQYGPDAFQVAAQRAQNFRRFDALAVARILEQENAEPLDEDTAPPAGAAAGALGDVDAGTLEDFGHLDVDETSSAGSSADVDGTQRADEQDLESEKEGSDGETKP